MRGHPRDLSFDNGGRPDGRWLPSVWLCVRALDAGEQPMTATSATEVASPTDSGLVVGDKLQPHRYRWVLRDVSRFLSPIVSAPLTDDTARRLLLHADGLAQQTLAEGPNGGVWWSVAAPHGRIVEIAADLDALVLVAVCLRFCPTDGSIRLHTRRGPTEIGADWPFHLDTAIELAGRALRRLQNPGGPDDL